MKLHVTVTAEIPVTDLSHYEADSIQEAASNQLEWLNEGSIGIGELIDGCVTSVSIVGVEESASDVSPVLTS